MALRVKCKCGKLMKIPTAQAGEKLTCPSCRSTFSIPLDTFRAFTAKTQPPNQAETLPAAVLPKVPLDPVATDPVPAELDLEMVPADAVAVTSPPAVAYAADKSWHVGASHGRVDMDVIQQPKRGFWLDTLQAFGYPFRTMWSTFTFLVAAVVVVVQVPLTELWLRFSGFTAAWAIAFTGSIGFGVVIYVILALLGLCIVKGWLWAFYFSVVQDTAAGSDDLPDIKMENGFVEDFAKPFLKYLGAFACAFLPAVAYITLLSLGALPVSPTSSLNLLLLAAAASFFWPLFVILFAFNAQDMLYRIDLIFTTIFRTFMPYLVLWVMLLLVGFTSILPTFAAVCGKIRGMQITVPWIPLLSGWLGAAGWILGSAFELFLGVISMRLIGLYYLHFKKRFTLIME